MISPVSTVPVSTRHAPAAARPVHGGGGDQSQHQPASAGADHPAPAGQSRHHVLSGRGGGRHQRCGEAGEHRQASDADQGEREHPHTTGAPVHQVFLEQRQGAQGHRHAEGDARDRTGQAQHHAVGEHDPAQVGRVAAARRHQRQLALAAPRADRERGAGQQHHLQQRQPGDQAAAGHDSGVVALWRGSEPRVDLRRWRRVQQHVPGAHTDPVLVELPHVVPGDRLTRDEPLRPLLAGDGGRGRQQ
jgi:hypothetical protein